MSAEVAAWFATSTRPSYRKRGLQTAILVGNCVLQRNVAYALRQLKRILILIRNEMRDVQGVG
ncbi:hypothetical protein Alches_23260 [Alicyclobacillus hesperidum subsp. aegles]|nr:hypothetical protein Alches_23260 [Alicyclobacillus hesperidum subsp. aegles]